MQPVQTNDAMFNNLTRRKHAILGLAIAEAVFFVVLLVVGSYGTSKYSHQIWPACVGCAVFGLIGCSFGIAAAMLSNKGLAISHLVFCIIVSIGLFVIFCVTAANLSFSNRSVDTFCDHLTDYAGKPLPGMEERIPKCISNWKMVQEARPWLWTAMISSITAGILNCISAYFLCDRCGYGPVYAPVVVQQAQPVVFQQQPPQQIVFQQAQPQQYVVQPVYVQPAPVVLQAV